MPNSNEDRCQESRPSREVRLCPAMLLSVCCLAISALIGCGSSIPTPAPNLDQSDIRNWDFSACLDDVSTCKDLLLDNQEVILGGRTLVGFVIAGIGPKKASHAQVLGVGDTGFIPPPPRPDAPDQADIRNWDFSACLEDFKSIETCKNLLLDNAEIILGGRSLVDVIVEGFVSD